MFAYRNREIAIDKGLCERFKNIVHAPIEKFYFDSAFHRKADIDVVSDDDIIDFSDYEIAAIVEQCMNEDIEAVKKRNEP